MNQTGAGGGGGGGGSKERWIKNYSSRHNILLVGEGDFSFSLSLAMAFGSATNILATTLDSYGIFIILFSFFNFFFLLVWSLSLQWQRLFIYVCFVWSCIQKIYRFSKGMSDLVLKVWDVFEGIVLKNSESHCESWSENPSFFFLISYLYLTNVCVLEKVKKINKFLNLSMSLTWWNFICFGFYVTWKMYLIFVSSVQKSIQGEWKHFFMPMQCIFWD